MKKFILCLFSILLIASTGRAEASVLTFNDPLNLGVGLGGSMQWANWAGTGPSGDGGHLFTQDAMDDDYIIFNEKVYLESFLAGGEPFWADRSSSSQRVSFRVDGINGGVVVWSINLPGTYMPSTFGVWREIVVNEEVDRLKFYSTYSNEGMAWRSVDDMKIRDSAAVPEPVTMLLFSSGLTGLLFRRRITKQEGVV